jgi:prepilin-type N-terminal cleavage/methylation domain-containing protein
MPGFDGMLGFVAGRLYILQPMLLQTRDRDGFQRQDEDPGYIASHDSRGVLMRNLRRKAVTLIELIVVIIVAGMLAAGAASFIRSVIDAWRFESFRSDVVSLSRLALVRMTREVRDIKTRPRYISRIPELSVSSIRRAPG